jgi:hypothetical protein
LRQPLTVVAGSRIMGQFSGLETGVSQAGGRGCARTESIEEMDAHERK